MKQRSIDPAVTTQRCGRMRNKFIESAIWLIRIGFQDFSEEFTGYTSILLHPRRILAIPVVHREIMQAKLDAKHLDETDSSLFLFFFFSFSFLLLERAKGYRSQHKNVIVFTLLQEPFRNWTNFFNFISQKYNHCSISSSKKKKKKERKMY